MCRLPLLEFVRVTSIEETYLVAFAYIEFEKKDNVSWIVEMCHDLLKSPYNLPKVIVIDRDNALMNVVAKEFLILYHISKN